MSTRPTLLLVIGTLACTALPTDTGFPLAYLHDDCAPWDGHALTLVLTEQELDSGMDLSYPNLRITSWRPPSSLAGSSFSWAGAAQSEGFATLCDSADSCVNASRVSVVFDRAQGSDDLVTGQVRVELEDGRIIAGSFAARRLGSPMLCG
jgi:hypothetical protein